MSVDDPDDVTDAQSLYQESLELDDATTDERRGRPRPTLPSKTTVKPTLHYRLLETLGRGGMGEVVAAHDEILGRAVAIKRMLEEDPDPVQVTRFLREARIQARLDHPAIPPVHELSRDREGRPYFVMKRLGGTPLSDALTAIAAGDLVMGAKFPRQRLLRAFADACLAVEFAHSRGVIHRDLKPANIMLGDYGETYVIDWGIAKVVGDTDPTLSSLRDSPDNQATRAGSTVGTPAYMAPEQRTAAADVDGRADVYALGCILFDVLGGRSVDRAELANALERRPSRYLADVAPELDDTCAAATSADRGRRIATARELGERVQRYLDGDRDVAVRRELALKHLDAARAAGDDALAMREAGRALALDPTLHAAAELVTRLMLEPPKETPAEVHRMLAAEDQEAIKKHAGSAVYLYLLYGLFIPYFAMMGLKEPLYPVVLVATLIGLVGISLTNARHGSHPVRRVFVIAGNSILILLLARMFTPFTIAPGVATVTAIILLGSPLYRGRATAITITATFAVAILAPFVVERLGFVSETTTFTGSTIILSSPVVNFPVGLTILGLVLFAIGFVLIGSAVARNHSRIHSEAKLRVHLQAWRLRQLVA